MPSTFFGISIGGTALQANTAAESVVGNNISNANTPGYSDETANFTEASPYTPADGSTIMHPGMLGTGVTIGTISRATDAFTTIQLRDAYGQQASDTAQQNSLNQVQAAFNEPSTNGLSDALTTFFQDFQNVQNNPEDAGVRSSVIQDGVALTQDFHTMSQQLSDVNSSLTTQLNTDVTQLNTYGNQIATLNVQIAQSFAQGQNPNTLEDQRDNLLDSVSKLGNINVSTQANGMVNVSVGNTNLVMGNTAYPATLTSLQANGSLSSGEISGLLTSQTAAQGFQSNLDTLAKQIVTAVNNVQYGGSDAYGNTGSGGSNPASPFFVTTGTTAGTITVNSALLNDPNRLAAAAAVTPGTAPPAGDGSNAAKFTAIGTTSYVALNLESPETFYQNMVSNVGSVASAATASVNNLNATVTQLQQQKASVTGVSTDSEMINMMKYQQAYSAAAQYVSAANSMIGTLITDLTQGG